MPRERNPNRDKAHQIWREHNGNITNRQIAEMLGEKEKTISVWKLRDKWNVVLQKKDNVVLQKTRDKKSQPSKPQKKGKQVLKTDVELTEKQVLFVAEYLIDFNATRAAMAVGYNKSSARQTGYRLLTKDYIQQEIKRQTSLVAENLGITSQRVLSEYLKIAFADITNYLEFGQKKVPVIGEFGPMVDHDNNPVTEIVNHVTFKESTEIDGTLISEVKHGKSGLSIKMHDKMKALDVLTKYLDLLPDHHKRMIEDKRLEIEKERFELEKKKVDGPGDDAHEQNNQYLEALNGQVDDVFSDEVMEDDQEG